MNSGTRMVQVDLLVIGAGVAGLSAALEAASTAPEARILVVSSHQSQCPPSTAWAQGGIAAAIGKDDQPEAHAQDTLAASAGLAKPEAVDLLTQSGAEAIRFLQAQGARFDLTDDGELALTREGAHHRNRILHAHGDATGREIWQALMRAWESRPQPSLLPACELVSLLQDTQGHISGARFIHMDNHLIDIHAGSTILATGGYGGLYERTSVSPLANGLALALAMQAGAKVTDLEFVQFHPTCLLTDDDPLPLISEAVRGEGAQLVNDHGQYFMEGVHPLASLAPRDIVSRAIWQQLQQGHSVYLDARHKPGSHFEQRFPGIFTRLQQAGLNPVTDLIPVTPATHYTMGGLQTDTHARTTLPGLFACGEVACTGVHGANRLASNSLLEGVVFGRLAAQTALEEKQAGQPQQCSRTHRHRVPAGLRALLWQHAGITRSQAGLEQGLAMLMQLDQQPEHQAACHLARAIVQAALDRRESVGAHFRTD